MSDKKKDVPVSREKGKDKTEEEREKSARDFKEAFDVTSKEEDVEMLACKEENPEKRTKIIEQLYQKMERALDEAAESLEMSRKRREAKNEAQQTSSEKRDPNSSASANALMVNMEDLPGERTVPSRVDRTLYEAFLGFEFKGQSAVDMFGFSEQEEQNLDDWVKTKEDFLNALPEDKETAAKAVKELGADIFDPYADNATALILACSLGNTGVVNVLLSAGAKVNDADLRGRTPLMEAVECGSLDLVQLLVKRGADVNMRDDSGNTALSLARRAVHSEVAEFLESVMTRADSAEKETKSASAEDSEQMGTESVSTEDPAKKESGITAHSDGVSESPNVKSPEVHEEQPNVELQPEVFQRLPEESLAAKDSPLPPSPPPPPTVVRQISSDYCSSDSSDQVVPDISRVLTEKP